MEATCKKKFEKDVYKSVFSVFLLSCSPKHLTDKLFKDLGYVVSTVAGVALLFYFKPYM